MDKYAKILAQAQLVPAFAPLDLAGSGGGVGDYVSLKNFPRVLVCVQKGVGGVAEPPTIKLAQAQDVAGTGSKPLNITAVYQKQAADIATIGDFTLVTQVAADGYTPASSGDKQGLYCIEVNASDLDINAGFDSIRVQIADVGATAQLATAYYLLVNPRQAMIMPPSAIVD